MAAASLSAVLLLAAIALVGDRTGVTPLVGWFGWLAVVLLVWLVGWPLWESLRYAACLTSRPTPSG